MHTWLPLLHSVKFGLNTVLKLDGHVELEPVQNVSAMQSLLVRQMNELGA